MSVLDLIRPDLKTLTPYIPTGDEQKYRLHANELPWSPVALDNVCLNHYPNTKDQQTLQKRMAEYFNVSNEELIITRGSDDGIDFLMRVFIRPGVDGILQCPPTFPMYAFYAHLQQAKVINCPLDSENDFNISVDKLISAWQPYCKLIMICQPNNPTGNLLDLGIIAELCDYFTNKAVIVVDEAYIDFAEAASASTLLSSFENLIVLRTLSKAYGLAGLRLGGVCAQKQVIQIIQNALPPYTISSAVMTLAMKALENKEWFLNNIHRILTAKAELIAQMQQSPWIETIYPSRANFLLVSSPYAYELMKAFAEQGIAVRYFGDGPLKNRMRITVGNEEQNQLLLKILNAFKPD